MEVPECFICFEGLDDTLRRPRCLPCGHTVCTMCIDQSIENGDRTCPRCRRPHYRKFASKLPINYAIEEIFQKLSVKSIRMCKAGDGKVKQNCGLSEADYYIWSIKDTLEELQKELIMKESTVNYHQNQLEQKLVEVECLKKDIQEDEKVKNAIKGTISELEDKVKFLEISVKNVQFSKKQTAMLNMYEEIKRNVCFQGSQLREEYFQPRTEKMKKAQGGLLGIRTVGGSNEGFPIFIGQIVEESVAQRHGGLKAGDRIIRYNGRSFEGRDLDYIRGIMTRSYGLITLEVRYSPVVFDQCREKYRTKLDPDEFYSFF